MKVYCNECLGEFPMSNGKFVLVPVGQGYNSKETSFFCNSCYETMCKDDIVDLDVKIVDKK